jgi:hypothetical protein
MMHPDPDDVNEFHRAGIAALANAVLQIHDDHGERGPCDD